MVLDFEALAVNLWPVLHLRLVQDVGGRDKEDLLCQSLVSPFCLHCIFMPGVVP